MVAVSEISFPVNIPRWLGELGVVVLIAQEQLSYSLEIRFQRYDVALLESS